ncbi:MAG: Rap1a/Tai family immunity protein [Alphaproteobacteria bacterium]
MTSAVTIAAIFTVCFVWIAPVAAQEPTNMLGGNFIDLCRSPNANSQATCGTVVTALMNAHVEMSRQDPDRRVICPPRTLTIDEGRRVFMHWANTVNDASSMSFPEIVMAALNSRYPCANYLKTPGVK